MKAPHALNLGCVLVVIAILGCGDDDGAGRPDARAQPDAAAADGAPPDASLADAAATDGPMLDAALPDATADADAALPDATIDAAPACYDDSECTSSDAPECASGACICVEQVCRAPGCASDADCGEQHCIGGVCVDAPAPDGLACRVLPGRRIVRQGGTIALRAVAVADDGAWIPGQLFSWTTGDPSIVSIDADGLATGGSTGGTTNISCRVVGGLATDSAPASVINHLPAALGSVRVVVTDGLAANPLAGATVAFFKGGALVGSPITTGADGVANASITPPVDVHVFHADHTWISAIGVMATDVLVPLAPSENATQAGGIRVALDASAHPVEGDVELGHIGLGPRHALIGSIDDEGASGRLRTSITVGTTIDRELDLSTSFALEAPSTTESTSVWALGAPGPRYAWALSTRLPLERITPHLQVVAAELDATQAGALLEHALLPLFRQARHQLALHDVVALAKIADVADVDGDGDVTELVPDYASFPAVALAAGVPASLATQVAIPTLPTLGGAYLDGVQVLAAVSVPGDGLTPVGISGALDVAAIGDAADGVVDTDPSAPGAQNTVSLHMAPSYGGLEAFARTMVISAVSPVQTPGSRPVAALIVPLSELAATTAVPEFLGFAETASFNLATRQVSLGAPVSGADFARVRFGDASQGRWWIYAPAVGSFTVPAPPAGYADRAVATSGCGIPAVCTQLRVDVFDLADGVASLSALAGFDDSDLAALLEHITRVSSLRCAKHGSCAAF